MGRNRIAMLLAFPAVAVLAANNVGRAPEAPLDTLACYVVLANDLTPLIEPSAPDQAATSPACAGPATRTARVAQSSAPGRVEATRDPRAGR